LSAQPVLSQGLISWGIALFEYLLQVPANRIGFQTLSLGQLKILQEVITLSVFVPFSVLYYEATLAARLFVGRALHAGRRRALAFLSGASSGTPRTE
jgi:uncharacterized protein (DUF486 family)